VTVAGLVLVRQKPGSAKGVMFITSRDRPIRRKASGWRPRLRPEAR
jgi:hypothetical protein